MASFGRMSISSVVPSRSIDGSERSTSVPGIVPETVPSKWTADASRVAWSERASISLGSVTFSGGVADASGPTPSTAPAPRRTIAPMATAPSPAQTRVLDMTIHNSVAGLRGLRSLSCRRTGSGLRGHSVKRARRPEAHPQQPRGSHVTTPKPVRRSRCRASTRGPVLAMRHRDSAPSSSSCRIRRRRPPHAASPSDFDGDGHADLAIGAPGEDVGGHRTARARSTCSTARRPA